MRFPLNSVEMSKHFPFIVEALTLDLASILFLNMHTWMVFQSLSLSTANGYAFSFGNNFSVDVEDVVNNIGSGDVVVNTAVSIDNAFAVEFLCFIFLLDRIAVAYANSISESVAGTSLFVSISKSTVSFLQGELPFLSHSVSHK